MQNADSLLEVSHLAKSFGGVRAVVDCSFAVPRGKCVGLIGPNGAGKSTVVELISGFIRPDAGKIVFDGSEIEGKPPHRVADRGLIRTFQTPREWQSLTVMENMLVAGEYGGRDTVWRALFTRSALSEALKSQLAKAEALLERFGLIKLRDDVAGSLSGGQKRLLEFARIAMKAPKMVLLDEPCAGVNPVLQRNIEEAIVGLQSDGITILLIEHNLPFVERACSDIFVMAQGSTIAHGHLEQLRKVPAVVDAYLGEVATGA